MTLFHGQAGPAIVNRFVDRTQMLHSFDNAIFSDQNRSVLNHVYHLESERLGNRTRDPEGQKSNIAETESPACTKCMYKLPNQEGMDWVTISKYPTAFRVSWSEPGAGAQHENIASKFSP